MRIATFTSFLAVLALVLSACSHPAASPTGVTEVSGSSPKYTVKGQYSPLTLDRVDSLTIESGKLVIHGSSASQTVDLPAGADPTKPAPHWALTTETDAGAQRSLVFTQSESLDDFTIELPAASVEVHYGVLTGPNGVEVMLLAWGEKSRCYWGYLTIRPKA